MKPFTLFPALVLTGFLAASGILMSAEPAVILKLPGTNGDPGKIRYDLLPTLKGEHAIISKVTFNETAHGVAQPLPNHMRFELHNYLAYFAGRFWCIWSDGPKIEDWPTQEIRFATSKDALNWKLGGSVTSTPKAPYAYIARGLWIREGRLLALAAHYKGKGAFGVDKELVLRAFAWNESVQRWESAGKLYDNAINNFPPQRLPAGEWILTRRDARFNVSVLIGGLKRLDDWQEFPVVGVGEVKGFRPDEPIFWALPNGTLNALYRDNSGSRRLFHSVSTNGGKKWGRPVISNFPNATSKLFSLQTSNKLRLLILNANPEVGRRELHLAMSYDGKTFTRMARLDIPSSPIHHAIDSPGMRARFRTGISNLQYPHAIERAGHLYLAFSRNKLQTELFRVPLKSIEALGF